MMTDTLQNIWDGLSYATRMTRASYHVTLEEMIQFLEQSDPDGEVLVTGDDYDGCSLGLEDSYRGYYDDLAFQPVKEITKCKDLLARCRRALGSTYDGYKGGEYVMDSRTPLWIANYSDLGPAIINMSRNDSQVIIHVKRIDP